MKFGDFSRYCFIFGWCVVGGVSGYWYASSPATARIKLEKAGKKLLRPGDSLHLYRRAVLNHKELIPKLKIPNFKEPIGVTATDEQARAVYTWCVDNLHNSPKYLDPQLEENLTTICKWPYES